jgi:predicted AAA+ superfamily ATPase
VEGLEPAEAGRAGGQAAGEPLLLEPSSSHPIYLLLDEIQLVRDWDKWVRRIHDAGKFRVYVTGSTSKLSSREVADALRGRSVDFPVFPFSFREFLKAKGFSVGDAETLSYLDERGRVLRCSRSTSPSEGSRGSSSRIARRRRGRC